MSAAAPGARSRRANTRRAARETLRSGDAPVLHITNGGATQQPLERSGVAGTIASWDDVLHEGPTPLLEGDDWLQARVRYLASAGYGDEEEMLRDFRELGDPLDDAASHDEVVFWFEHDLHCQLLLTRHLWWLSRHRPSSTRLSIVMGPDHLGLLKPADFPARFAARRAITDEQIAVGAEIWTAYCGDDPRRLLPFLDSTTVGRVLPSVPPAIHRLLEEFPGEATGLGRSERQILDVLSDGPRTPEQAFVACATREEDIWMGDWSFWTIAKRLAGGAHPLVAADVRPEPGRVPSGTLAITAAGRRVLAGDADHLALNEPSRWIGGTCLAPPRVWRWTGSSLRPPAPGS